MADLLGVTERQVRKWLRTYRTKGLEALCTLHQRGDLGGGVSVVAVGRNNGPWWSAPAFLNTLIDGTTGQA